MQKRIIDAICVEQQGDIYKFFSSRHGIRFIIPTQYFRSVVGSIQLTVGSRYPLQFFDGHLVNIVQQIQEETKKQIQTNQRLEMKAVDKIRRPIEEFLSEGIRIDKLQERISIIQEQFPAWRKVVQDGNQFYRSIGIQYVEFLARATTSIQNLERIKDHIQADQGLVWDIEKFRNKRQAFIAYLQWILDQKSENPRNALLKAQNQLKMPSLDKDVIYTMRGLTASYYEKNRNNRAILNMSNQKNYDSNYQNITYGKIPKNLEYFLTAYSLQCQIVLVELNSQLQHLSLLKFPSENQNNVPQLYILYHPNNYHILYPTHLMQIDGYNLSTGEYDTTTPVEEIHHPIDNQLQQLPNQN